MFRTRLAAVIGVSFCFVLLQGWMLYQASDQAVLHFQHSQSAYEAFKLYERLSQEANRYFKQRMDELAADKGGADAQASKQPVDDAITALGDYAVNSLDPSDRQANSAELGRVARITAFLKTSEYLFDAVEGLRREGKREAAKAALARIAQAEIEGIFQPLIKSALDAERDKARQARERLGVLVAESRGSALVFALAAALFGLTAGIFLLRGVKRPIEALLRGTDEIAKGRLEHRIRVSSQDEFGYLAAHFNQMADELERQQAKLREGRAEMERRVAERTVELNQLNDQLQRMDVERREFLADVSHELRTPITVIRGEAEVTLRGQDRDVAEYKEALLRIVDLSEQLGKYVNDLMFLARADTGRLQFEWDTLDLAELVAMAVDDFQIMAQEKTISVWLNSPGSPVWVRGDRQRLRQVLFILGDNACRYSNPSGHIAALLRVTDAKEAVFSISDLGIGIPQQDLGRIFDRHFRSQNARRKRGDGSGLGLPMAQSIIKAHGGQISVTSVEKAGTTFTVTLPLTQNDRP